MLRTAWYGRLLFAAGTFLTATTGVGLWGWPTAVGESFAWEIRAPLTSAWMGAWYIAAAGALGRGLIEPYWSRARIALVVGLTLTATSLIATARFFGEFRIGVGTTIEQLIAWVWLIVYVALPPAVLVIIMLHQRRCGREDRAVAAPLLQPTRFLLAALAAGGGALGVWLTAAPAALERVWPWKLADLPASIVGTWCITLAVGAAWALRERDWRRCRVVLWPSLLALALQLIALARLHATLAGRPASTAVYAGTLGALLVGLTATGIAQERRLAPSRSAEIRRP